MIPPQVNYLGSNFHSIKFAGMEFYYSYTTLRAFKGRHGFARIESPSRTTGKHLRSMGVSEDCEVMDQSTFDRFVSDALTDALED